MKKVVLLILAGLTILLCLRLFCSSGRYQIAFGHVRWVSSFCLDEEKTDVIPVCFKIDTFTGRCWIYRDSTWITCTNEYVNHEGFEKIPKYK
jgi:transposase InsO family protein